jgi:Zn-finger nucleic acid-binding protein
MRRGSMGIVQGRGPIETKLPCPVCLIMMEKAQVKGRAGVLTLDHCVRCGGVWFERGEVQALAMSQPAALWTEVAPRADTPKPLCHNCQSPLDRDAAKCGACGKPNVLDCPSCDQQMRRHEVNGLVLDVCERCHGVWFDNKELSAVWRLSVEATQRRPSAFGEAAAVGGDVLLNTMFWAPGLVVDGAIGAAHLGGAALEAAGGAAEGVFEAILGFISSLFDG